jgi:hypothetical protein
VREVLNIFQAADCGCHIVTVPHDILAKAVRLAWMDLGELSRDTVKKFHQDAVAADSIFSRELKLIPSVPLKNLWGTAMLIPN